MIQGRSWEDWLEKYIVYEVYLRAEKYNLSPPKKYISAIFTINKRGLSCAKPSPQRTSFLGPMALFLVGLNC